MITIRSYLCKACGYCIKFCPKSVLKMGEERNEHGHFYPVIANENDCTSCAICAVVCPEGAIEVLKKEED